MSGYVVCKFATCTKVFFARNSAHRYCSKRCQRTAKERRRRMTPFDRECRYAKCKKPFMPTRNQLYCSTLCKNRHLRDINRDHRNEWRRAYYARNSEQILTKRKAKRAMLRKQRLAS